MSDCVHNIQKAIFYGIFSGFVIFISIVSSVLCLAVVASTQQIPSAMREVSSLQKKHPLKSSIRAKEAYHAYFGMPVGDQDKRWAPHVMCEYCRHTLEDWFRGEKRAMRFAIPRIWREPSNHLTDCYFCMVDPSKRRKGKNAPSIK